jgi:hypothetical protein
MPSFVFFAKYCWDNQTEKDQKAGKVARMGDMISSQRRLIKELE